MFLLGNGSSEGCDATHNHDDFRECKGSPLKEMCCAVLRGFVDQPWSSTSFLAGGVTDCSCPQGIDAVRETVRDWIHKNITMSEMERLATEP